MDINDIELKKISVADLQKHVQAGDVTVVDVRVHPSGEQIARAIRVNPADVDDCDVPKLDVPKDRLIVTYCT